MEIQSLATGMAQGRIQEEAAVAVTSMALQTARDTGENIARIMDSAEMITDPARGNFLDVLM
ncbi:MAG: YjfB family protein [Treponema sp.]|nr:YjfB family protein [Treponema sp.]